MIKVINSFQTKSKDTIWKYYAFNFLWHLHFFSAVLVPFFTDWGGISQVKIQILQSWFMFWIFIMEVPTGAIADFLGRKYSLALGALVVTFGALIYGNVPKFEVFLLGEFLFATSFALLSGADKALLYDALKEKGLESESKKIFGNAHAIGLASMLISAPIGSIIASKMGLNFPMLLFSIPAFLACLVGLTIREPKIKTEKSESRRYTRIAIEGFKFFLNHKSLRILAIDGILVAAGSYFVLWLYQPLLKSAGLPISYFGFAHAGMVAAEVIIASNFVRLEKLVGSPAKYLKASALFIGLAFILVGFLPNLITISLFIAIAGGFGLTRIELMTAHMNKHIPSEQRATVLSSISMFRRLALVIINPVVGLVVDWSLSVALILISLLPLSVFFFSKVKAEMLDDK